MRQKPPKKGPRHLKGSCVSLPSLRRNVLLNLKQSVSRLTPVTLEPPASKTLLSANSLFAVLPDLLWGTLPAGEGAPGCAMHCVRVDGLALRRGARACRRRAGPAFSGARSLCRRCCTERKRDCAVYARPLSLLLSSPRIYSQFPSALICQGITEEL